MRRGEIWTISGGNDYTGKPRPAVIVQDDAFDDTQSIAICAFTTTDRAAPMIRLQVDPDVQNGLQTVSYLMVDKIAGISRSKIGKRIGRLDDANMRRLSRSLIVFLGLIEPPGS